MRHASSTPPAQDAELDRLARRWVREISWLARAGVDAEQAGDRQAAEDYFTLSRRRSEDLGLLAARLRSGTR